MGSNHEERVTCAPDTVTLAPDGRAATAGRTTEQRHPVRLLGTEPRRASGKA
jgi:hypothetical protein